MDHLSKFVENCGPIISKAPISGPSTESLPEDIKLVLETNGNCLYKNGLYSIEAGKDLDLLLSLVLEQNDASEITNSKFTAFGRTAFGSILVWLEKDGEFSIIALDPLYGKFEVLGTAKVPFFLNVKMNDNGFLRKKMDLELFNQCLEKLGPLEADECYGFSPIPALGGDKAIQYAEKVKLKEYLSIKIGDSLDLS